jgi:hypothetical protein
MRLDYQICRYYIDKNNVLQSFVVNEKYLKLEYITSDEQAQKIIDCLNGEDESAFYLFESQFLDLIEYVTIR